MSNEGDVSNYIEDQQGELSEALNDHAYQEVGALLDDQAGFGGPTALSIWQPFITERPVNGTVNSANFVFGDNGDAIAINFDVGLQTGTDLLDYAMSEFGDLPRDQQVRYLADAITDGDKASVAEYLDQMDQAGKPLDSVDLPYLDRLLGPSAANYSLRGDVFTLANRDGILFSAAIGQNPTVLRGLDAAFPSDPNQNPDMERLAAAINAAGSFEEAQALLDRSFNRSMEARNALWRLELVEKEGKSELLVMKRERGGMQYSEYAYVPVDLAVPQKYASQEQRDS